MQSNTLLGRCDYCGKKDCRSHAKYSDRGDECGKRYAKLMNYKARLKNKYTNKGQLLLDEVVDEYRALMRKGYKVPKAIAKGWDGNIF